jgi:hypothetical protein
MLVKIILAKIILAKIMLAVCENVFNYISALHIRKGHVIGGNANG